MKIAHVDVNYGEGSTGKIVRTIHNKLIESGINSKAFYGRGEIHTDSHAVKISSTVEVFADAALSRITGYTGVFSPISTRKLITQLNEFNPDLVHLHELHGYYLNSYDLLDYLSIKKIPTVWTLHCEIAYTGRCGYAFDCDQWKTSCIKCPTLDGYPKSLFFDKSSIQFERKKSIMSDFESVTFAPVSNWLHARLKQSFLKDKRSITVYNGINTENCFFPREFEDLRKIHQLDHEFIVLSVAPDLLSERKGGHWVLEAAKCLEGKPITFIMIGVTNPDLVSVSNVICLPPIKDQDLLAKYYSLADIFLLTSQSETFSLTCAESLSCGTPIIGFDSGGPVEVAPCPFGHFVKFADIESLTSLILKASEGNILLPNVETCASYASSRFDNRQMFNNYLKLYKELMGKRGSNEN